jgi:hypothetical protein
MTTKKLSKKKERKQTRTGYNINKGKKAATSKHNIRDKMTVNRRKTQLEKIKPKKKPKNTTNNLVHKKDKNKETRRNCRK